MREDREKVRVGDLEREREMENIGMEYKIRRSSQLFAHPSLSPFLSLSLHIPLSLYYTHILSLSLSLFLSLKGFRYSLDIKN